MPASIRQEVRWADFKVLVTGGAGFIGRHLCRRLSDAGGEVHATSRQPPASAQDKSVRWWQADFADVAATRRIFSAVQPDIVFHLAGSVGAGPSLELVLPTFHSLLTSSVNVLTAATERGCRRIILAASLTEPTLGSNKQTPHSPYAAAKWTAGGYARMFHALYETPVVLLRPFMTYGPAQSPTKVIPSTILSLLRGERPRLSSGRVKADWVYIADIVDAFVAAATAPDAVGRTIDLGTGKLVPLREVVDEISHIVAGEMKPDFGALPDRPGENEIAANTADASELLGWRSTTSLEQGLRQTVDWFRLSAERPTA